MDKSKNKDVSTGSRTLSLKTVSCRGQTFSARSTQYCNNKISDQRTWHDWRPSLNCRAYVSTHVLKKFSWREVRVTQGLVSIWVLQTEVCAQGEWALQGQAVSKFHPLILNGSDRTKAKYCNTGTGCSRKTSKYFWTFELETKSGVWAPSR